STSARRGGLASQLFHLCQENEAESSGNAHQNNNGHEIEELLEGDEEAPLEDVEFLFSTLMEQQARRARKLQQEKLERDGKVRLGATFHLFQHRRESQTVSQPEALQQLDEEFVELLLEDTLDLELNEEIDALETLLERLSLEDRQTGAAKTDCSGATAGIKSATRTRRLRGSSTTGSTNFHRKCLCEQTFEQQVEDKLEDAGAGQT
ncbi:unnamed protein product, partial [Amoebophrya sp. A25]